MSLRRPGHAMGTLSLAIKQRGNPPTRSSISGCKRLRPPQKLKFTGKLGSTRSKFAEPDWLWWERFLRSRHGSWERESEKRRRKRDLGAGGDRGGVCFLALDSTPTTALRLHEPNRGRISTWPPGSFRAAAFLVERNGLERWPFLFCLSAGGCSLTHSGGAARYDWSLQHLSWRGCRRCAGRVLRPRLL